MTGLGNFIGGAATDPLTADGLMISAQAIMHVAGDSPRGAPAALTMSDANNMSGWAGWVRASLYLTDFLRNLDWKSDASSPGKIDLLWNQSAFVTLIRPSMDLFTAQTSFLRDYMDQRSERAAEILTQVGYPIDYFAMILGLNAPRNPFTFELIAITQVLTSHVAMVAKHHLACRRPDRLEPTVMPMIPTPGHGTFPSAHAAEAFAVATVLEGVLGAVEPTNHYPSPKRLVRLIYKQAERIAVNRTVAGMHFPIDTWAGAALGEAVGQLVLALCGAADAKVVPRTYAATDVDFAIGAFRPDLWSGATVDSAQPSANGLARDRGVAVAAGHSDLLAWLWGRSLREFELA